MKVGRGVLELRMVENRSLPIHKAHGLYNTLYYSTICDYKSQTESRVRNIAGAMPLAE